MPIASKMYRVLCEGLDVLQAVVELISREAKPEVWCGGR